MPIIGRFSFADLCVQAEEDRRGDPDVHEWKRIEDEHHLSVSQSQMVTENKPSGRT